MINCSEKFQSSINLNLQHIAMHQRASNHLPMEIASPKMVLKEEKKVNSNLFAKSNLLNQTKSNF